jgi:excisionase family DNA binding protein
MSRFLTPTDVAAATGYTRRWVLRQIELGRLAATAFDAGGRRSYRIRDTDLAAFRACYLRDARDLPQRDQA